MTHTATATPAAEGAFSLTDNELLIGILLAILSVTLIPWSTVLATSWFANRRERDKERRMLYREGRAITKQGMPWSTGPNGETNDAEMRRAAIEQNDARHRLKACFGLLDGKMIEATKYWGTYASTPEVDRAMQLWANGSRITARIMARRIIKKDLIMKPQGQ